MQKGRVYVMGLMLTILGGCGIANISVDSDILFWTFAIIFSIGVGCCCAGYER